MKRKTSQRAAIEQVFCQLDRPLGIEEILETGRMAVESLNQATVYRVCNRVYDLPGCALNEREAAPSGFLVEDHECFLFGVCPACHA